MAKVTIEGSISPSARLARGERIEVQRTERIDKLIAKGFAVVVDAKTGEPEESPLPEAKKAPAKSASQKAWVDFLTEETDIEVEGKTRDQLADEYDEYLKTHDAPASDES